ncbi:ATP-dependent DNA helicase PIF1, partial [Pseudocercospora fuligena]
MASKHEARWACHEQHPHQDTRRKRQRRDVPASERLEPSVQARHVASSSTPICISSDSEDEMCDPQFCIHKNKQNPSKDKLADLITCAGLQCAVSTYHKICVGRANAAKYPDNTNWHCRSCRGVPTNIAAVESQPGSSTPIKPAPAPYSENQSATGVNAEVVVPVDHAPSLHPEQREIVDAVMNGYNVFYTGSAGTGKSTVLREYVRKLKEMKKHVDIIAPSGIAAVNVGGGTFFSYMGCRPDDFRLDLEKFRRKAHGKKVQARIGATDVLIIDEISMVESQLLTRLDIAMREARSYWIKPQAKPVLSRRDGSLPFGGVQIVVTGDFCQLPPVKPFEYCLYCDGGEMETLNNVEGGPKTCRKCHHVYKDEDKWAFKSPAWAGADFLHFELKEIHRQNDLALITLLQKCRFGIDLPPQERRLLCQKSLADPVKLMPTRAEVQRENDAGLRRLRQRSLFLNCLDMFDRRNSEDPTTAFLGQPKYENRADGPLKALGTDRFEEKIELKVGTLVLLLVNLDFQAKLVNGTQGKIVDFKPWDPVADAMHRRDPDSPKKRSGRGGSGSGSGSGSEI